MAEKKTYYIRVCHTLVEVTEEVYKDYHKMKRQAKTLAERDVRNGVFSYDALDTGELLGEELVSDWEASSVEETALAAILHEKLYHCLELLPASDRELLHALFFMNKTEREYAKFLGISQKAVNKRRQKALARLRVLMKN